MVRRNTTRAAADFEEVFTDLQGNPESAGVESLDLSNDTDLETELTDEAKRKRIAERAELEVVDDEELDEQQEDDEQEEAVQPAAEDDTPPRMIFDPRDVQLVLAGKSVLDANEQTFKGAKAAAEAQAKSLDAELEAAHEAGDSKKSVEVTNKLAKNHVAIVNADAGLDQVAAQRGALQKRAEAVMAAAPRDAQGNLLVDKPVYEARRPKASKLAADFHKHNPWFADPKNANMATVLSTIDSDIANEKKLNRDDPAYFEEMGRRFNKLYPGKFKMPNGKAVATGQRQRRIGPAVPGGSSGDGTNVVHLNPREVRLTNEDLAIMRTFEMEDTPANRKQFLLSKRELVAQEARKAG